MLVKQGQPNGVPDTGWMDYMLAALFEAGPAIASPLGGEVPLDWPNVWAYAQATGAIGEAWEFRALIDASAAYVRGKEDGKDVLAVAPVEQGEEEG